jgi:thiamine biosynthesis protein ThiS
MTSTTIRITVNGEPHEFPGGLSLLGILEHFALDPRAVVVERNRAIVRRAVLEQTPVQAGDSIEIVHFVGGG